MDDSAAWDWAQAAVSKRLLECGITEDYLAETYARQIAALSPAQLVNGADTIRAVIDELSEQELATFTTSVEQRDTLAALFVPTSPTDTADDEEV